MTNIYIKPDIYEKALRLIDKNGCLSISQLKQELLVSQDTAKKIATQLLSDFPDIKIAE